MVALLLVGIASTITLSNYDGNNDNGLVGKANAVEIDGNTSSEGNNGDVEVATHDADAPSTISMTVSGDRNGVVETGVGVTAYRTHDVEVNVMDVQEYYLKISGSSSLNPPTGGEAVPSVTTAVTGNEMPEDSWGYAWEWNRDEANDDANMTYVGMPNVATSLDKPVLANGNANFIGKLSFAAKFKQNAVLGNYGSGVTLTLIATPRANTESNKAFWYNEEGVQTAAYSDTDIMQKVAPNFCRGNDLIGIGWTITLRDDRDGKEYKVVKLRDGNCWMQENLALEADPAKYPNGMTLAPGDTDLPADTTWVLPKSVTSWSTDNSTEQVATGSISLSGWKQGYGNYYSWNAATAGTGSSIATDGGVASGSICPKGWTLPTGGSGGGQFQNLFGTSGNDLGSTVQDKFNNVQKAPYSFSAAGYYDGSLDRAGSYGYYWSRTSSDSNGAYLLRFDSSTFSPGTNNFNRYLGYSVRCVQAPRATWSNGVNTDLRLMQDITKPNFTEKYCKNNTTANALVPVESTIQLSDSRDGRTYTVVKLKDGNCWMQENLALSGSRTLTNGDSDVTAATWNLPADTSSWGTSDTSVNIKTGSTSLSGWQQGWGNYYSWQAATAGAGSSATNDGTNATSSICPKGWKLPTGQNSTNPDNQFQALLGNNGANIGASNTATAFTKIQAAPYKFFAAGYYDGPLSYAGTGGLYWSRTSSVSTDAYYLYFRSGVFYPGTTNAYRYYGYSVRCIAEPAS